MKLNDNTMAKERFFFDGVDCIGKTTQASNFNVYNKKLIKVSELKNTQYSHLSWMEFWTDVINEDKTANVFDRSPLSLLVYNDYSVDDIAHLFRRHDVIILMEKKYIEYKIFSAAAPFLLTAIIIVVYQ